MVDLSTILAAPMSATLLGDFGADVIKVEEPNRGDTLRRFAPFVDDEALTWRVSQRNKRSVTVDLRRPAGRDVVCRLVSDADVVVTNFRLPTLQRWGLDYEDLVCVRPDLIMLHLTAFGRTGPWRDRPGFARVAEAFAGLTYITGHEDRPPLFNGYPVGDALAGVYGAYSILLALVHRQRTGEGQFIDLGLYEPILRVLEDMFVDYGATGRIKERHGNRQEHSCPNDLYPTADGTWVVIPASNENMWSRLTDLLGDPELTELSTLQQRLEKRSLIDEKLARFTLQYTAQELIDLLDAHQVAAGLLHSAADVLAHPQVMARGNFEQVWDTVLERHLTIQAPVPRLSATPGTIARPAPRLGEHTREVLTEARFSTEEIDRLIEDGVV